MSAVNSHPRRARRLVSGLTLTMLLTLAACEPARLSSLLQATTDTTITAPPPEMTPSPAATPDDPVDSSIIAGNNVEHTYGVFLGEKLAVNPFPFEWEWQVISTTSGLLALPPEPDWPFPSGLFYRLIELGPQQIVLYSVGGLCPPEAEVDPNLCSPQPMQFTVDLQVEVAPPTNVPLPTPTPFPTPVADVILDLYYGYAVTVTVGQTLAILRPSDSPCWTASQRGYPDDLLVLIGDDPRASGPQGWLFEAVKPGEGLLVLEEFGSEENCGVGQFTEVLIYVLPAGTLTPAP